MLKKKRVLLFILIISTYLVVYRLLKYADLEVSQIKSLLNDLPYSFGTNNVELTESSAVLVTGGAGFIGSSVCKQLRRKGVGKIVVLDTFNNYYSIKLKRKRAELLETVYNVDVLEGDVCNSTLLSSLNEKYKFTHILHLAAQAGVRYSLINPYSYLRENVECFVVLMEFLRSIKENKTSSRLPHFVYASSSSVYGLNKDIPFKESDSIDKPSNIYGITKQSNELIASAYFNLYGLTSIGLRFFTVYGPWGRPDMAPYLFSDNIWNGVPITVFNEGKMQRDFTYIDDIVKGILSAMGKKFESPIVFNLGNNKPVNLTRFINFIETKLNRTAIKIYKNSKSEIPITYASIDKAKKLLDFSPETSFEQGFEKFLDWFLLYNGYSTYCASDCYASNQMCIRSSYDDIINTSKLLTKNCKIVVYSVIINKKLKRMHEPAFSLLGTDDQSCYIAFISGSSPLGKSSRLTFGSWKLIPVADTDYENGRVYSRIPKISPNLFLSENVKYAIYIDSKLKLMTSPENLVSYLFENNKSAVMAAFRHDIHKYDVYKELRNIIRARNSRTRWSIVDQVNNYKRIQDEKNITYVNLIDAALLIHNMKSQNGKLFRCKWFNEYMRGGDRDQLSFAFVLPYLASEIGEYLYQDQEWCPIAKIATQGNYSFEYIRLISNSFHWTYGNKIAKYLGHASYI